MEPQHYYNLAFVSLEDGGTRYMNRIVTVELPYINSQAIQDVKDNNNLPNGATLITVSYLGFMTEKQWEGN